MNIRCEQIINMLGSEPISASSLARKLSVSRQVIVGDIAILRASGHDIIATSKGYIINEKVNDGTGSDAFAYVGMVACRHDGSQLEDELYTVVDYGGTVIDVSIEHAIYGELCGRLDLSSRYDVDEFMCKVREESNSAPISSLTGGVHLHRIGCSGSDVFERILKRLTDLGIAM